MTQAPQICVLGAGAIGSVTAARILRGGIDVSLVARGARLAQLQRNGLTYREGSEQFTVAVNAVERPASVPDYLFVAVKAQGLADAIESVLPMIGKNTLVIPMVNGIPWWLFEGIDPQALSPEMREAVDPGGRLAAMLSQNQIAGCVVYTNAEMAADGKVSVGAPQRLVLGTLDGHADDRLDRLAELLVTAGIQVTLSPSIRDDVWTKVALNLATNPLSVVTGATLGELFSDERLFTIVSDVLDETWRVASRYDARPTMTRSAMLAKGRAGGAHRTSMLEDYLARRPLELRSIFEVVEQLGRQVGIAMPASRTIAQQAKYLAEERRHAGAEGR